MGAHDGHDVVGFAAQNLCNAVHVSRGKNDKGTRLWFFKPVEPASIERREQEIGRINYLDRILYEINY